MRELFIELMTRIYERPQQEEARIADLKNVIGAIRRHGQARPAEAHSSKATIVRRSASWEDDFERQSSPSGGLLTLTGPRPATAHS